MQVQYLQLLHETTITQNVTQVSYKGTPFMETPKRDNSRINICNKTSNMECETKHFELRDKVQTGLNI